MTQASLAWWFGFSLATARDWEQGRYQPARSALPVIEREPEVVARALNAAAA